MLFVLLTLAFFAFSVFGNDTVLLSFDGVEETTSQRWILTNDPVMGGVSNSTFEVLDAKNEGLWVGDVKIVPSLAAPGFCNLMSDKRGWPDASGYSHMIIRAKSTIPYDGFKVSFGSDTLNLQFKVYSYIAIY